MSHKRGASGSTLGSVIYPDSPLDVGDWAQRRAQAKRRAPKPLQIHDRNSVLELDESAARVDSPWDEDDEALTKAIQKSEHDAQKDLIAVGSSGEAEAGEAVRWSEMFVLRQPIQG